MSSTKDDGATALNTDFEKYEQVSKPQQYRLAEQTSSDERADDFDDELEVGICDLSWLQSGSESDRLRFVQDLGDAMKSIGFAILTGHGVDPRLWHEAEAKTLETFTGIALEDKLRYRAERHGSVSQGYFPIKETSAIHPDLVEGWVFCRRAFDLDIDRLEPFDEASFWPRSGLEPVFRQLVAAQENLILPITQSIFEYLGVDPHHYDDRLTRTNFGLRLNYYPPIGEAEDRTGAGRLLGHEDVDLFTLLPAPRVEGLQALHRANGKWVRLEPPADSLVLNTGDYMQRITNDILPSTTHRVSKPRDPELLGQPRISLPMAIYVWEEQILEVLPGLGPAKYEPIKAITFHTRATSKFYGDDYAVEE